VAVVAGALFVLAMGSLTVAELLTGKSVASTVGNSTGAKTTVGGLLDPGTGDNATPTPGPTPSATTTPTSAVPETTAPTTEPTTEAPSSAPLSVAPTSAAPTAGPTGAPTGAPQQNLNPGQGQSTPKP